MGCSAGLEWLAGNGRFGRLHSRVAPPFFGVFLISIVLLISSRNLALARLKCSERGIEDRNGQWMAKHPSFIREYSVVVNHEPESLVFI